MSELARYAGLLAEVKTRIAGAQMPRTEVEAQGPIGAQPAPQSPRQAAAVSNFTARLPPHSHPAQQVLKDPYAFDFFTLEAPFLEWELEAHLLQHLDHDLTRPLPTKLASALATVQAIEAALANDEAHA
ncbi:MAG: DUF1016 family protein [Polyangiaceae bacterium]|nr:DUF1016 family protein [Polyangiaceae bacterium]